MDGAPTRGIISPGHVAPEREAACHAIPSTQGTQVIEWPRVTGHKISEGRRNALGAPLGAMGRRRGTGRRLSTSAGPATRAEQHTGKALVDVPDRCTYSPRSEVPCPLTRGRCPCR
jgi:hypothetical protein